MKAIGGGEGRWILSAFFRQGSASTRSSHSDMNQRENDIKSYFSSARKNYCHGDAIACAT